MVINTWDLKKYFEAKENDRNNEALKNSQENSHKNENTLFGNENFEIK